MSFKLPEGKIEVRPIIRPTAFIQETNHKAAFLVDGGIKSYAVPYLSKTGVLMNPLTDEEKEWFENESGMKFGDKGLSVYGDFWKTFTVDLDKNPKILDKSVPEDYLKIKLLLTCKDEIAPNLSHVEPRLKKQTYKYVLVDLDDELDMKVSLAEAEERAWEEFGALKVSRDKMFDFLRIYGRKPSANAKDNFLINEIRKIVKENPQEFVSIVTDPDYEMKIFVQKAVRNSAILTRGRSYFLKGGDKLGEGLKETIDFLKDLNNQDIYLAIKAELENNDD